MFSRNVTPHISAAASGKCTFTENWTVWEIASVVEKLGSLNEKEIQWTIK